MFNSLAKKLAAIGGLVVGAVLVGVSIGGLVASKPATSKHAPSACEATHDGPSQPTGSDGPVFMFGSHPYFSYEEDFLIREERVAVYGDGTVAVSGRFANEDVPLEKRDPLTPFKGGWLEPCDFDWAMSELEQLVDADFGSIPSINDGQYGKVHIALPNRDAWGSSVDQFGIEDGPHPELTREETRNRKRLRAVIDRVESEAQGLEPLPDNVRVVINGDEAGLENIADGKWAELASGPTCQILTGQQAANARQALRESQSGGSSSGAGFGGWMLLSDVDDEGEGRVSAAFVQVMPGTHACSGIEEM